MTRLEFVRFVVQRSVYCLGILVVMSLIGFLCARLLPWQWYMLFHYPPF